jgi:hypothetical protein
LRLGAGRGAAVSRRKAWTDDEQATINEKELSYTSVNSVSTGSIISSCVGPVDSFSEYADKIKQCHHFTKPEEPASDVRLTRRGVLTNKSSSRTTEEELNNDEAFAAKLAMEEQMQQSRQLRSRRNDAQSENKRPVALTVPKMRKTEEN